VVYSVCLVYLVYLVEELIYPGLEAEQTRQTE